MNNENLYTILGVQETATQDEIKKAYRDKSKKCHPDVGGSEDEFKKVNEAYSVLSDENKKREYDFRKNNPNMGNGFGMGDFFDQMFGSNPFGFSNERRRPVVPDKIIELEVTPEESYLAVEKVIQYVKKESCNSCKGKGGDKVTCQACKGQGFFSKTINNGFFNQILRSVCNYCNGNGYTLTNKCYTCQGNGFKQIMDNVKINIPHGIDNGQFLKLQGKGDYSNNGYGNLLLKIKMIPSVEFEKINNDLIYNRYFTLEELNNESFVIPHPSGHLTVKFPTNFDTSVPLRVKGKGYHTDKIGDLYVKMNIRYTRKDLQHNP